MQQIPTVISIAFIATTLAGVFQFYRATNKSKIFLIIISIWMIFQMIMGLSGFYTNGYTTPPRLLLMLAPPLLVIVLMMATRQGRQFTAGMNIRQMTLLHMIRIPVEIVLYYLFVAGTIPEIMTFAGRNMDIVAGLTAPVIYYIVFARKGSQAWLIGWNVLSIGLLLNIVVIALLSAKTPFQRFGFEQPNVAITLFPINWLPSVLVPLVFAAHVIALRQLITGRKVTGETEGQILAKV